MLAATPSRSRTECYTPPVVRDAIARALREAGYRYVTLDLDGYRTGSVNEAIRLTPV